MIPPNVKSIPDIHRQQLPKLGVHNFIDFSINSLLLRSILMGMQSATGRDNVMNCSYTI
jgi:hypothetical protein